MEASILNPEPFQNKIEHSTDPKGNGKDHGSDPEGFSDPPLLDHHEELGDAGDEEGHGHETHQNLMGIEFSFLGQNEEACCAVVSSEKSDDKGLGHFGRKPQEVSDQRGEAGIQEATRSVGLMKDEEEQGPKDEEGNGLFEIPFNPGQGFDHDI